MYWEYFVLALGHGRSDPVNPDDHLSWRARKTLLEKDSLIQCHESHCLICFHKFIFTENKHVLAVPQVSTCTEGSAQALFA